jgi:hypothetical protein
VLTESDHILVLLSHLAVVEVEVHNTAELPLVEVVAPVVVVGLLEDQEILVATPQ